MEKRKNKPLIVAAIICVISVIIMIVSLTVSSVNAETAEFTPPPFEEKAVQGVPNVPDGLGWNEVDAQVYKASICGEVIIEDNTSDIWLTNPDSNTVWLKLRILDSDGNILGETGIIKPGEYVQSVEFDTIPEDGETIGLKLMAYEPETYYSEGSATLNTTVKVEG